MAEARRRTRSPFSPVPELVEEIRRGRMVILVDDEDRENEGDLVMAAEKVRPEDVNFMARYGRGLICLTLTPERCRRLGLPLMVPDTHARHATAFTVSIEAARGVTTGISAADRATTIRAAVAPDAGPEDIVTPGHVFPLMAQPGGVLTRAGHTEAGCDLARLAGLEPAAVIVEILNEDGTMARRPDLERFARRHGLKMGTIADLIQYRLAHERTVALVAESPVTTRHGPFRLRLYRDQVVGGLHLALVRGSVRRDRPTLVRVHVQDLLCDLLGGPGCGLSLDEALARVAREGEGVVVVLQRRQGEGELLARLRERRLEEQGGEAAPGEGEELRTVGLGAQILADVGVGRMRVLGSPRRFHGLSGFGLEVVAFEGDPGPAGGAG